MMAACRRHVRDASDGKGRVYLLEADGSWRSCGSNMVHSIVEYMERL